MDAFFAAIEAMDNPYLKGKAVIVGGSHRRGVVSTASYEARRFGVHSAMPIFMAKEKCPHGIFLPVRMMRYKEISRKIMGILENFSPLVEKVSIDEAYLDITGTEDLLGSPRQIARKIKEKIRKETGLSCSIGIAPTKFLAKIASDMHKPDGLTILPADEMDAVLLRLPVEKIPGVGKRTVKDLRRHGIQTARDLKRFDEVQLVERFGKFGVRLHEIARGKDLTLVEPIRKVKSISSEQTLYSDTSDVGFLKKQVTVHSDIVARRLRSQGFEGRTVTIKVKYSDFSTSTKSSTIINATDSSKAISDAALKLLENQPIKTNKVRLIGVGVSNLTKTTKNTQMNLFPKDLAEERDRKLDIAIDEIKNRFGNNMIKKGNK
jgi:DNA polymerase-4